jgi:Zn-dependent protease with chaperone function
MDRSRYVELERRLERLAADRPRVYKARALLLALAGYGYLGLVVAGLVALCVGLMYLTSTGRSLGFAAKIGLAFGSVLLVIARSLWVRIERPTGIALTRADAPRLFDEVERIRRALRAPRVHQVLLTDEYNAAVAQVPRLGIFGWYRNYLIVGYPLLAALTAAETCAVLAHEFAHLSRAHSRFTGWIYRVRRTWFQVVAALHGGQQAGIALFKWFADWYTPYFGAYSMVLARRHEFEADRLAASVVGRDTMADALVALRIRGRAMQSDFWDPLGRRADERPDVPTDVFTRLTDAAAAVVGDERAAAWLEEELRAPTDVGDTHPSLADRVTALVGDGAAAAARAGRAAGNRAGRSAAAEYLGESGPRFARDLDQRWARAAADSWRERHEHLAQAKLALAEMQNGAAADGETTDSLWRRATLTRDVHGPAAALPLIKQLLEREPGHAPARYAIGMSLLERGDAAGIGHVEFAMARDHEAVVPGCELVRDFLIRTGRADEAERYVARAWAQLDTYQAAREERSQLTGKDRFAPHTLDESAVTTIRAQLEGRRRLRRALLVDKVVQHIPEEPMHVLALVPAIPLWAWLWPAKEQEICAKLLEGLDLPPDTWAFALPTEQSHIRSAVAKVPGAEIYRRPRRGDLASKRFRAPGVPTPATSSPSVP